MTPENAGRLLDIIGTVAESRPAYATPEAAVDALGVGGIMRRLLPQRLAPCPENQAVMDRVWGDMVLEVAEDLSRHLAGAGIDHAVFKGAGLLLEAYQPGDIRLADVDVLVDPACAEDAVRTLAAHDFAVLDDGALSLPGSPAAALRRPVPEGADFLAVDVDLHGLLWPARRLLPWKGRPLPDEAWQGVERAGRFPVFRPGHHAALLVHHLVRHDFMHFRSVVDLVALWEGLLDPREAAAMAALSRVLEVDWAARAMASTLSRELSLSALPMPTGPRSGRSLARPTVSVARAAALALDGTARDFEAITLPRALRRLLTVDSLRAAGSVLRDALIPPDAYLAWRWPGASPGARRLRHLGRIIGRVREAQEAAEH